MKAPVRNTAAETLSVVLKYMEQDGVGQVLANLLNLQQHTDWQVRHGGLLGIKYLVAVRSDLIEFLLPDLLPIMTGGLKDEADDVRAAAAQAFLPIAHRLIELQPKFMNDEVIAILWDALLVLDDLTASTSSVLQLLCTLLAAALKRDTNQFAGSRPLTELIPRLWPFLRHGQATVRRSVLQTLRSVLMASDGWVEPLLLVTLRYLFQNLLTEAVPDIRALSDELWGMLIENRSVGSVAQCVNAHLGIWLGQLITPVGLELDAVSTELLLRSAGIWFAVCCWQE
jgi:TATA-binding protein-associated factor